MQVEEQSGSGGTNKDQLSFCGMAWMKRGGRNANAQSRLEKIGLCGADRDQRKRTCVFITAGPIIKLCAGGEWDP